MALLGAWIKVVRAEVLIEGPVLEHVIDGRKYRCRDGQDGLLRATPRADAVKLSLEVGAFRSCRRPGALHESALEPGRALANAGRSALTCALVAARADARPGDQVSAGGKAAHVNADLGKNCLSSQGLDARDGAYLFDGGTKGRNAGLHLPVDLGDGCIDGIDLTEMQAQQKAVALRDTPAKGFTQALLGSLHAGIGQTGELGGILLTGDQRLDHLSAACAHDIGDHRVQLDVGVLESLLNAQDVAGLLAHELLARAEQRAHLLRWTVWHKARPDQAVCQ